MPRLTRDREQLCGYEPTFSVAAMPVPSRARAAAPTLTLAALCEGKSGPQPGYIELNTGGVVDCGGAAQPAAAGLAYGAPFSNPLRATEPSAPPSGYVTVWNDGRLNLQRGYAAKTAPQVIQIPTKTTPVAAPVAAGSSHIQVASFGISANAARAVASLEAAGLPAQTQTVTRSGTVLMLVTVGPLQGGALTEALATVRASGFADAFVRG